MSTWLLFGVGFVAATALWLGLRVLPRRVRAVDAVRAFGEAHGARVTGDGVAEALRVVGSVRGRMFTVVYQLDAARGDVLLAAVDCAAADGAVAPDGTVAEGEAVATRFVGAGPEVTTRLDAIVEALVDVAEGLERGPSEGTP